MRGNSAGVVSHIQSAWVGQSTALTTSSRTVSRTYRALGNGQLSTLAVRIGMSEWTKRFCSCVHQCIACVFVQAVTVDSPPHAFPSPSPVHLLHKLWLLGVRHVCLDCRLLSSRSFYPTPLSTFSTIHCLYCSACIKLLFELLFPGSILGGPGLLSSILRKARLLHNTLMPVFLADSIRSCPAAFSFSGNGLVVAQDWVEESERERSDMGRICCGRRVWDQHSHVDMNLAAFCSHRLSILPPPCRCSPMPETS